MAYQLSNEYSWVEYLPSIIENDDAGIQTAIANVEEDTEATSKHEDFEQFSTHLLPEDPVMKKRNNDPKQTSADILDANVHMMGKGNKKIRNRKKWSTSQVPQT